MIKGALLDIAGVLDVGGTARPDVAGAVARLRAAGIAVRFVTNSTRRPKRRVIADLRALGIAAEADEVFTPVAAALAWLRDNGYLPHLVVHPALEEDFAGCGGEGPAAVVIGDAADRFTYGNLNAAFRAIEDGAPLLALADNRVFRDKDGRLSLDAGAFVRALEYASGETAILFGKPAPDFFRATVRHIGCDPAEAVMVGDDAESDVAGALAAGLGQGVLVRTGKYRDGDEAGVEPRPSAVVDDIGAAVDLILKPGRD